MKYTLISIITILFSSIAFSQANPQLDKMKLERINLLNTNQNYAELERNFASTGVYPDALVQVTEIGSSIKYTFSIYKNIASDQEDKIESRFKMLYPAISEIQISNNKVDFSIPNSCDSETILSIFTLFGYTGFTQTTFE